MTQRYRVTKKIVHKDGEKEEIKYYATAIYSGIITTAALAKTLEQRSSLTKGDVISTIAGLADLIEENLQKGYKVQLDGIGIFSLTTTSNGHNTPEECTASRVKAKKISFLPDVALKRVLKKVRFKRVKS